MALKSKYIKLTIAVLCISLALPFSNAFSLSSRPQATNPNTQIDQIKAALEYASKEEKAEIQIYLSLQEDRKKADANLASLDKKIKDAEGRQQKAETDADNARAEYAASQAKLDSANKQNNVAKELRKKAISRMYQDASNPNANQSLLTTDPKDRVDAIRLSILMKNYSDQQVDEILEATSKAQDAEAEKLLHEDARLRAEAAEKIAQEEADSLVPLRADLAAAQKVAKDNEAKVKVVLDSLKSKKSAYNKQIAQLTAESNALAAKIKKEQVSSPTPAVPGRMIKPINSTITSPFGYRIHPIYGTSILHAGIDLRASTGTPIKAAKAGKVIFAGVQNGYGNTIVIDHGGGVSTLYAHQTSFAVGNGATVTQGQVIGYSGMTGNVTGPHLHWEVRVNGSPSDPMGYL